ncbi:hypothetical protein VM1G_10190 [Cytospora mali]|uniref:Uncharacterized protein n=1 Tax=Cytospora mali TaxID=578113 RepID=A0A194WE70_CYTMA|nr:hypothetical protein VM1G_10190 [Valsa mali]
MAQNNNFQATDAFTHRYVHDEVLRRVLNGFGFKEKDIKMRAVDNDGAQIQVQLPRKLTDEEREKVLKEFEKAHEERQNQDED